MTSANPAPATGATRFRRLKIPALLVGAALALGATFFAGISAEQRDLPERLGKFLERKKLSLRADVMNADDQELTWTSVISTLHTLEYIEPRIGPPMGG